jgi:hypothetical protein
MVHPTLFHPARPALAAPLAAGLITLLSAPDAAAQERITLEAIGAVRMVRFEEVRPAGPGLRPAQAAPARDPAAGRTAKAR